MSSSKKGFDPLASLFDLPETLPAVAPSAPPAKGDALPEATHLKPAAPVVPPLSGPDPAQLAKILARAAVARAGAPKPAPGGATLVPESRGAAPASSPKPAAKETRPPAAAAASPMSRLMAAPPPRKTVSVEEAMRLAGEEESRRRAESAAVKPAAPAPTPAAAPAVVAPRAPAASAPASTGDISDVVGGIIQDSLPELGAVYVAKALVMDDRGVLTALWRAHRARFGSTGDVAGAVAVSAVLRALAAVRPGQLAVAHAVTDKSDWLIWVDLSTSTTVAAFKDARAWFAGA